MVRAEKGEFIGSETLIALCATMNVDVASIPVDEEALPVDRADENRFDSDHYRSEMVTDLVSGPTDVSESAEEPPPAFEMAAAPRRRLWPHLVAHGGMAASLLLGWLVWSDIDVRKRIDEIAVAHWGRTEVAMVSFVGRSMDLIAASQGRPEMRAAVMRIVGDRTTFFRNCDQTYLSTPPTEYPPSISPSCFVIQGDLEVTETGDASVVRIGPLSARMGKALATSLYSQRPYELRARYVSQDRTSRIETAGPWFEPSEERGLRFPDFPMGGWLDVSVQARRGGRS